MSFSLTLSAHLALACHCYLPFSLVLIWQRRRRQFSQEAALKWLPVRAQTKAALTHMSSRVFVHVCVCVSDNKKIWQQQQKSRASSAPHCGGGCCFFRLSLSLSLSLFVVVFLLPKSCNLPELLLLLQRYFYFLFFLPFLVRATHAPLCNWFSFIFFFVHFSRLGFFLLHCSRALPGCQRGRSPGNRLIYWHGQASYGTKGESGESDESGVPN